MSRSDLQSSAAVVREKAEVEAAKGAVEGQAGRLTLETERLRRRAQELENEVAKLNRIIDEAKLQESRLGDRVGRLEVQSGKNWSPLFYYMVLSFQFRSPEREEATGRIVGGN